MIVEKQLELIELRNPGPKNLVVTNWRIFCQFGTLVISLQEV